MAEQSELEVLAVYEIPAPESLSMAELDEVLTLTGIDIAQAQTAGVGISGRVLAALVTWSRNKNGENVTFDQVYRSLTGNQVKLSKVDPPQTG